MEAVVNQLEEILALLESSKITSRRKGCETANELLRSKEPVEFLKQNGKFWWNRFFCAIQSCLIKDAEKKVEEIKKRGSVGHCSTLSGDVFSYFIRIVVREGAPINMKKTLSFMTDSLKKDNLRKCYGAVFLKIISQNILTNSLCRSQLQVQDWEELFLLIKSLIQSQSWSDNEQFKCLHLLIKWGPCYKFPVNLLRGAFSFITKLCKCVMSSPLPQQEAILEAAYEFCKHTAKDNRMACCKMGEVILPEFINLYESNAKEYNMKTKLLDFFLLQIAIHNPKGVTYTSSASYAVSWENWNACVSRIYYIMGNDVETSLGSNIKTQLFFVTKGDKSELLHGFVSLFVEIFQQIVHINREPDLDERPQKRVRKEGDVCDLINKVKETKSWIWIALTSAIMDTYPDLFLTENYSQFLQFLTSLQIDCKDTNLRHHIYKALIIIEAYSLKSQNEHHNVDLDAYWATVADTSLRSIGLSQNEDEIQKLLQRLIKRNVIKPDVLFPNYLSKGVVHLSDQSLNTLEVAFKHFTYLQGDHDLKCGLVNWILNCDSQANVKFFHHKNLARILITLVLSQWTTEDETSDLVERPFEDIENVYSIISLEDLIKENSSCKEKNCLTHYADTTVLEHLLKALAKIKTDCDMEDAEIGLNVLILMLNAIGYLIEYNLLSTEDMKMSVDLFDSTAKLVLSSLQFNFASHSGRNYDRNMEILRLFKMLFSARHNVAISSQLRGMISEDLIRIMFVGLSPQDEENDMNHFEARVKSLKTILIEAITTFAILPNGRNLLQIQEKALECLLNAEYEVGGDTDYELVTSLLHTLKSCGTNFLSDNTCLSIFNLFQSLCTSRYHCHHSAFKILELFHGIYPLIFESSSLRISSQFVEILSPFYTKRDYYGPEVSVALLNCMGLLYEMEPKCEVSRWQNEEIVFKIPEFLTSDYVEVRIAAIKNLAKFFRFSTELNSLSQYHMQEIMFAKIYEMNLKVFQIEGDIGEERIVDETVTRCSGVLQMFATVIVSSSLWMQESLFSLFRIVCDKNIDLGQIKKILVKVAQELNFKSDSEFLEKYVVSTFCRWKTDIDSFPFTVFNCNSKVEFFAQRYKQLAPFIVEDVEFFKQVATFLNTSEISLVEDCCSVLLGYCIAKNASDLEQISDDSVYKVLIKILKLERLRESFNENIDDVLLSLVQFVKDETDFKKIYDSNVVFSDHCNTVLSVKQFQDCIQFIENTLLNEAEVGLMLHLLQNLPNKVHLVLRNQNYKLHKCQTVEESLKCFHHYSVVIMMVVEDVKNVPQMQEYVLKDVTHSLLHHIENYKKHPELTLACCRFLKHLLSKVIPDLVLPLKKFILFIFSRLKTIAAESSDISSCCQEILHFLIVTNKAHFSDEIRQLDGFPRTNEFDEIYKIHSQIKEGHMETLKGAIEDFLNYCKNIESFDECEHGLKHLRRLLTRDKNELKAMYDKLRQTRGFSDDCQDSLLHKLICLLVRLIASGSCAKSEALRCLGEIGPADVATLVLQPEAFLMILPPTQTVTDPDWTPWELVCGHIISMLAKYIIDADADVVRVASDGLFKILNTKEGKKMAASQEDFGYGEITPDHLMPFFSKNTPRHNSNISLNHEFFLKKIAFDELWTPKENSCHTSWITKLMTSLLESFQEQNFFATFIDLCNIKTDFCEEMLPLILFIIVCSNNTAITNMLSSKIQSFFDQHWKETVVNKNSRKGITMNRASAQCMLNAVHFIRLQESVRRRKKFKGLELDYLKVANAAQFCSAHFTAILYAELWCEQQINLSPNEFAQSTCSVTKLDKIIEQVDEITGRTLQEILRKAYKSVGEIDALLGCGTSYFLDPKCRVEHYKELGKWDQVMHHHDIALSHRQDGQILSLMDSLKHSNLHQLSLFCCDSLNEPDYESLWRLSQWGYKKPAKHDECTQNKYDKFKFYALKSLNENDRLNFTNSLNDLRDCIIQNLSDVNLESSKNFYSTLTQIQSLKEIEDFDTSVNRNCVVQLINKWKIQDEITINDFQYVEPIKVQRVVLLSELLKNSASTELNNSIINLILEFAEFSRLEGHCNLALRTLENLRHMSGLPNDLKAKVQLEEAQLCWAIKDDKSAKCILRQLCSNENANPRFHAMALKLTGEWMVESSSENRSTIMDDYFLKSINLLHTTQKTQQDVANIVDTYDKLAKFNDKEYQQVMSHINSDAFQKKKKHVEKARETVSSVNMKKASDDLKRAICIKRKQCLIDENEIKNTEDEKDKLLLYALKYYLLNLTNSDGQNTSIFRIVSLLLDNRNNKVVKKILDTELIKIASYKFIDVLPQMIPHISNDDAFSTCVSNIIEKCAIEHPYHTLPLVLSLVYANKDRAYTNDSKTTVNDVRTQTATKIINKVKKKSSNLQQLIKKMESMSEALIEFAYSVAGNENKEDVDIRIPKNCKLRKIQNFDDVLLPTCQLAVQKNAEYTTIVGIHSFDDFYRKVGGVNRPKFLKCRGTDGVVRSQLIKGQDDLRQDAVMQQVFTMMNNLLAMNKQTKNLLIRTYKIVPLSMRSGILEWVANSMPIGEYLAGKSSMIGAHEKYRPMDKTPVRCRMDFKKAAEVGFDEKLKIFKTICKEMKPIFHKFFEATFPQPTVWYERRRAYINSVATTSMCGYILGIGDRHVSNILIDKSTAEVIHIDFGIAFEQGRVLPTPETVPFRLTRDMVDGMGVSGVEGVFRRSCEKTMEVLRKNYQTIATILEVLLYDPLYDWTVSSAEANKRQHDESEAMSLSADEETNKVDVNLTAERALLRLKAKLQGTEYGKLTSVENQVGSLIQQAVDPSNLCRLFNGWQPYL